MVDQHMAETAMLVRPKAGEIREVKVLSGPTLTGP
jgi:hypothetical protein